MRKIELHQSIQLLANLGVIAGIVFLGVEIGQNTRSLEISAYQDLVSQMSRLNELSIEHPRAVALVNGAVRLSELSPEDRTVASQLMIMIFRHGDMAFYQYERGAISDERLESATAVLRNAMCNPNPREIWLGLRRAFAATYQAYVDSLVAKC